MKHIRFSKKAFRKVAAKIDRVHMWDCRYILEGNEAHASRWAWYDHDKHSIVYVALWRDGRISISAYMGDKGEMWLPESFRELKDSIRLALAMVA